MLHLARRMKRLGTETAFEVLEKAKALEARGRSVIHLEIGEPDLDTPQFIKEAAKRALDDGWTHYGPSAGLPELRQAIAEEASRLRRVSFNPEQVVVTPGGKPIMSFAIMACVDESDEVIYPNPGFPIYESMISFMGGIPVAIPLREENDFRLDVEELKRRISKKTKMIIINSPHNPTGSVLEKHDLQAIADIAVNRDIWVLSDEIYSRVIYEGTFESIAQFPEMRDRLIVLDGFSKTYAMTGWRVGYGLMPEDLAAQMARIETNINSCTTTFIQRACIEALKGPQDEVDKMVAEFKRRRDVIVEGLNRIKGIRCRKPRGAFYVFPNVQGAGLDCEALAECLLEKAGVACLAGTCFGEYGDGYMRLSYATSMKNIVEALERIARICSGL